MKSLLLLFLSIGGVTAYYQSSTTNTTKKDKTAVIETPTINEENFDISLQIEKTKDNEYDLSVNLELEKGAYVISPFSKDEIYGHFEISIPKTHYFVSNNELIELPKSIEELDPIIDEPVHFVRTNTTYKQRISLLSKGDFEVDGLIEFVLEPLCIPYDVAFTISNTDGLLKVTKTKTSISKKYKR